MWFKLIKNPLVIMGVLLVVLGLQTFLLGVRLEKANLVIETKNSKIMELQEVARATKFTSGQKTAKAILLEKMRRQDVIKVDINKSVGKHTLRF